jgi:hypothetical protein
MSLSTASTLRIGIEVDESVAGLQIGPYLVPPPGTLKIYSRPPPQER